MTHGPFGLPEKYQRLSTDELRQELPYVWRLGDRLDVQDELTFAGVDLERKLGKACILPPEVADEVDGFMFRATPALKEVLYDQDENPAQAFQAEYLAGLDEDNSFAQPETGSAGFVRASSCPIEAIAPAFDTTGERLETFLNAHNSGRAAMAQVGQFGVRFALHPFREHEVSIGGVYKLTPVGSELVRHTLNLIEKIPRFQDD